MDGPWTPPLAIQEHGRRCRLLLANEAWGDGATLQEAADDLVARVVSHAAALRAGPFTFSKDLCPPDPRWFEFLYEVGDIAARGGDVRQRIVGAPDDLGQVEAA
jgi:hypothetical protein